jgi:hypothetical protein
MKIVVSDERYTVGQESPLLEHENAIIKLRPGCVWSRLLADDKCVGLAFQGSSRFAVDAITETDNGAVGGSIAEELGGIQIFLGRFDLDAVSSPATPEDISAIGYSDGSEFRSALESKLENAHTSRGGKFDISPDSALFIGTDTKSTELVIVAGRKGTVFTYGKLVYIVGGDNNVSVTDSGIRIHPSRGPEIKIDKHGIEGLESLSKLGPMIERSVRHAVSGISKFQDSFTFNSRGHPRDQVYDNVDDFDWND